MGPDALVAREAELGVLAGFLGADGRDALVLEGTPGVGKSSLWERCLVLAEEAGFLVLTSRASDAEAGLPFAAVIDLLDDVGDEELAALPTPQRSALGIALYRERPTDQPPDPQAISLGLLAVLRRLSAERPLLIALDDTQWLDRASDEALAFAARRLTRDPVRFLLARRRAGRPALEDALGEDRTERLSVEPISLGATRQLLAERLDLRLTHHLLRRIYDVTLGNPLFALELGRVIAARDPATLGDDLPLPDHVEDLLGMRIDDLTEPERQVLLAIALDAALRVGQLQTLAGVDAVDSAVRSGVVVLDGERARPAHPLFAAAASRQATARERRDLHRGIAEVVVTEQRRALHLALATAGESADLAATVAEASRLAAVRGSTRMAVELAGHALRLTPPDDARQEERLLDLCRHLAVAGEKERLTDLLADRVENLTGPAHRVAGWLLMSKGVVRDNDDIRGFQERALTEAGDDLVLGAPVMAELAENTAAISVVRIAQSLERAELAHLAVPPERPADRRLALAALAWTRAMSGMEVLHLGEEYHAMTDDRYFAARSPRRVAGQRAVWRGEIEEARALFEQLRTLAQERAEPSLYALIRLHLCELELRIGDADAAEALLDDWADSLDSELLVWPMYERCRALVAAGRGDPAEARRWGLVAEQRAAEIGVRWDWLESNRALGLAALLEKNVEEAVARFAAVWEHTEREGVLDPGTFPVGPDLIEALAEAGATARAHEVLARLQHLAWEQDHPWARLGTRRGTATLALVDAYDEDGAAELAAVAAEYAAAGLHQEAARTLLTLGRAQRRARKWGAARETLERAVQAFEQIGAPGWADDARAELERVGARRPAAEGTLTPTELRVATLAAEGLTNKEIARALVVTVNTVEFHLRNTYAKLDIRGRVQLAGALAADTLGPPA